MKRHIRKAFAICVAMVLIFVMAVPALGLAVNWSLSTYPYTPHTSTTVNTVYLGYDFIPSYCESFTVSVGTANIRVSASSYTIHSDTFPPYKGVQWLELYKTKTVALHALIPVKYALEDVSHPSTATTSAYGIHFEG